MAISPYIQQGLKPRIHWLANGGGVSPAHWRFLEQGIFIGRELGDAADEFSRAAGPAAVKDSSRLVDIVSL
jgi:hypothetical protein